MTDHTASTVALQTRKPLGEIFADLGILTELSTHRLIDHAKRKHMRLGELLEEIGMVTSEESADALAIQYRCRRISDFAKYSYSQTVLKCVPLDEAVKNTIYPLKIQNGKIALAVADPTTEELFEEIASRHNLKPAVYVATRADINRAIARHYLGQTSFGPGSSTILVVEDDQLVREMLAKLLTRKGYTVETAIDGMDAFGKIFTLMPKLVITDKFMPKLGGYEFLYAIRNVPEFRYMPVILITTAVTPDEEKDVFQKGFFDFLLKPIKEIALLTRVERAFQSSERIYGRPR